MPRFFFHYRGPDDEVVEDRVGSQHTDIEAAEREAHQLAMDILEDELREGGSLSAARCVEVEDEDGQVVLYLPFWASFGLRQTSTSAHMLH